VYLRLPPAPLGKAQLHLPILTTEPRSASQLIVHEITLNKYCYCWSAVVVIQNNPAAISFIGDPRRRTRHNFTADGANTTKGECGATSPSSDHPPTEAQATRGPSPDNRLHRRTHSPTSTPDLSATLRTIGYAGRTHSSAASLDLTLLRKIGYAGRTHSPTASYDLCVPPDTKKPAAQSGLTRQQFVRTTEHLHRPTTQAAIATSLLTIWPPPPPHRVCTTPAVHQTSSATLRHTHRKFTSQHII